jgi:hypothetical protein
MKSYREGRRTAATALSQLGRRIRSTFSREEIVAALEALPDHDPDFRRVRALVRQSRERYERRFERAALDFARAAPGELRALALAQAAERLARSVSQ